jgi:glycosyltransferase involved in cell wall biosynthesis
MNAVLFIEHLAGIGGGQICLLELLRKLDRTRFDPVVVCVSRGELYDRIAETGAKVEVIDFRGVRRKSPLATVGSIRSIAKIIRRYRIRLVHVNSQKALLVAIPASLATGVPILWHCHVDSDFGRLYDVVSSLAAKIIVVNSEFVRHRFDSIRLAAKKIRLVYNGIDLRKIRPADRGRLIRQEFGIDAGALVVGTLGRLQAEKGMEYFFEAAPAIAREIPGAKFLVVGGSLDPTDPYESKLRSMAHRLGVAPQTTFTGFRPDIADCISAMDIVVIPSLREGLPLAVAEAMAMEKPIVASAVGGIPEMIESNVSGALVPPGDSAAIAGEVIKLAKDRALASRWGKAARTVAEAKFDIETHARNMQDLYSELVA